MNKRNLPVAETSPERRNSMRLEDETNILRLLVRFRVKSSRYSEFFQDLLMNNQEVFLFFALFIKSSKTLPAACPSLFEKEHAARFLILICYALAYQ
jgi:hypothetical protein